MTLQELETTLLQLAPSQKRYLIQVLKKSLNVTEYKDDRDPQPLSLFFQHSPLATVADELDLTRDRSLPPAHLFL
jgi:hypothetical protein